LLDSFTTKEKQIVNFKCTFKYNMTLYKDKEGKIPMQEIISEEISAEKLVTDISDQRSQLQAKYQKGTEIKSALPTKKSILLLDELPGQRVANLLYKREIVCVTDFPTSAKFRTFVIPEHKFFRVYDFIVKVLKIT
jgi:ABC-type branched-subunit amino acid transport system ATPase component